MVTENDKVMFCHQDPGGDWREYTVATAIRMVDAGKWKRCYDCEEEGQYDDGMMTFHCAYPCPECDGIGEAS